MTEFIQSYPHSVTPETCRGLIFLFNDAHKRKATHAGLTGTAVDTRRKDSTDLSAARIPEKLRQKYDDVIGQFFEGLNQTLMRYVE